MSLLLDTDTCILALKEDREVQTRLMQQSPARLFVSVVTECELLVGAAKSRGPARTLQATRALLEPMTVLEFTSPDAAIYAELRGHLEKRGEPIGPLDTLIAAHACSRGLTLVTHNTREFSRVPGLRLTDWTKR